MRPPALPVQRIQPLQPILHDLPQIIARPAEAGVPCREEIALGLAQVTSRALARALQHALIGLGDLAVEHPELRIGANHLLDLAPGCGTIERRAAAGNRIQRTQRLSAEFSDFRNHGAAAIGRVVVAGVEPQRRLVIGKRLPALAHLLVEHGAVVVGLREIRIELQRSLVVVERRAELALEMVGIATVGEEVGPRRQPQGLIVIGNRLVVLAHRGQRLPRLS